MWLASAKRQSDTVNKVIYNVHTSHGVTECCHLTKWHGDQPNTVHIHTLFWVAGKLFSVLLVLKQSKRTS
jgi:hypothetical protein